MDVLIKRRLAKIIYNIFIAILFLIPVTVNAQMSKSPNQYGSTDSVLIDVNRFKLMISNIGGLADKNIPGQPIEGGGGGLYYGNIVLLNGVFYLFGISIGFHLANGSFSDEYITDYVPGKVGTITPDP